jgi:hypothetical protein
MYNTSLDMAMSTLLNGSSLEKFLTKTFEQSLEMNKLTRKLNAFRDRFGHLQ